MNANFSKPSSPWPSNYEKKLLFSYGAVVFLLILVIFAASSWLFHRAGKKNIDQLATTVTRVISDSLKSISFSGKYHTRNLVQEMVEKDFRLSYIAVQNLQGVYFAHSNPQRNDKAVSQEDIATAAEVVASESQLILYRTVDELSVLEVVTPFYSGYEQQIVGVVRVGISTEQSNADLNLTRLYLTLLSILMAGISLIVIIRISRHFGGPVHQMAQTLKSIMDHAPMAIYLHTEDGTIVQANLEFQTVFGSNTDLPAHAKIGDFLESLNLELLADLDQKVLNSGKAVRSEIKLDTGSEKRVLMVSKFPVGFDHSVSSSVVCTFLFDITATRNLEQQLRQSQKMEAVGHLAGGVAHDFNNLLTGIIGYADLAMMMAENNGELEDYLEQLLAAASRASQLTKGLLAFSRKQVMDLNPVDLNDIVSRMESLLKRVIGEDIVLTSQLENQPVIVLADAPQIEQIILNLATNSRDAMPQGGSLRISTAQTFISEDDRDHSELAPGHYAVMEVSDSGCGISQQIIDKVFEPFFTTKEVGKGTGLGLSMAYGIIKQHNGKITIESEPENGTTTRIFLPMGNSPTGNILTDSTTDKVLGGKEKILLVEDEEFVRNLLHRILSSAGYDVVMEENGLAGLEFFKKHSESIDLVLMDMIMPEMNGQVACDAMRKIRPQQKVLFISGYTANHIKEHTSHKGEMNILYKPVRRTELLKKIRTVLNDA